MLAAARHRYEHTCPPSRDYQHIRFQAKSWLRELGVIVMAEVSALGDNVRFIVTSFERSRPSFLYESVYCDCGRMENFIKDHKNALKSGRTSCHSFIANSFRLMLHSAAYMILLALRENLLAGTDYATVQFDTILLRPLKVGAEVREMKTKLRFFLPYSFSLKEVFAVMHLRLVLMT